jgi:hypothetical protein
MLHSDMEDTPMPCTEDSVAETIYYTCVLSK